MNDIKRRFGEKLKNIRKLKGYTQEKFAECIGVNLRQLARIEAGESFVTAETLYNICIALNESPSILFGFNLHKEDLKNGTDNITRFKVIKSGNVMHLVDNINIEQCVKTDKLNTKKFDEKMFNTAKKLNRNIIVDEIDNGIVYATNIYKPNGIKESTKKVSQNQNYNELKNKIEKIANENNKIEFLNLAFDSLSSKKALERLKLLLQGIELTLNDN